MEEPTRESQRSLHEEIALAIRCRLLEERAAGRLRALADHLREVPREHAAILERVYREVAAADIAGGPDAAAGRPSTSPRTRASAAAWRSSSCGVWARAPRS